MSAAASAFAVFVVWFAAGCVCLAVSLRLLRKLGLERANYRGERIPLGLGATIWAVACLEPALLRLWEAWRLPLPIWLRAPELPLFAAITLVFAIGLIDDVLGDSSAKGIKGHMGKLLREGIVTTGLAKAAVTALAALAMASQMAETALHGVIGFGVILLSTNALNLLDLRPARALKAYFAGALALLAVSPVSAFSLLLPVTAGAVIVFGRDLRGRAMLGDMGANVLGFSLGVAAFAVLPLWGLAAWLALTAGLHYTAERVSLTSIIERNRLLAWLDQAGRRG